MRSNSDFDFPSTHIDFDLSKKNDYRFKKMQKIVVRDGLEGFFEYLKSNKSQRLGIGVDFYPSNEDLQSLVAYDKSFQQLNNLPKKVLKFPNKTSGSLMKFKAPKKHNEVFESDGYGMEYVTHTAFTSWEGTIKKYPQIIFMPKSKKGLSNLVKWAEKNNLRVRASGYRHSSSEMYADNNQIFLSMLDLHTVTDLPAQYPKMNPKNEMQNIKLVGEPYFIDGKKKIKCKIGGSTCNYHLQDWVHDPQGGNWAWTLPMNVIMTEITLAGSNATICHGAGINNKTLSDLVKEIEFVNVRGELQTITDSDQIKAAAGCFGMLGIVTSLTLELDEMTYANLETVEKKLLSLTVPVPKDPTYENLNENLSVANLDALHNEQKQLETLNAFIDQCENSYYSEFFWFPLQHYTWTNCWKNNGDKKKASRYPNEFDSRLQRAGSYIAYLSSRAINDACLTPLLRKLQTELFSHIAMTVMPHKPNTVCSVHDALHFRRGIQNFKTRMLEIEIPVPDISNTQSADWSVVQKAWWSVINNTYSKQNRIDYPLRTTFEMRIMSGSDVIMAAQHGNKRTCSIEVLTPLLVDEKKWQRYMQEVLDEWSKLKNDQGEYLLIRPHWAKRFDGLMINRDKSWIKQWDAEQKQMLKKYVKHESDILSIPIRDYLSVIAYKNQIVLFKKQINMICAQGGYTYDEMKQRFSNSFLDEIMSKQFVPQKSLNHYARFFNQQDVQYELTNDNQSTHTASLT